MPRERSQLPHRTSTLRIRPRPSALLRPLHKPSYFLYHNHHSPAPLLLHFPASFYTRLALRVRRKKTTTKNEILFILRFNCIFIVRKILINARTRTFSKRAQTPWERRRRGLAIRCGIYDMRVCVRFSGDSRPIDFPMSFVFLFSRVL